MSEFEVRIVKIGEVTKHPNADTLSITTIDSGYPVVFKTGTYSTGDYAVYIPVDAVVPNLPIYAFLGGKQRIKAKRLRGVFSMGMLMPLSDYPLFKGWDPQLFEESVELRRDFADALKIEKYEPPMERIGKARGPQGGNVLRDNSGMPRYTDIHSWRKGDLFAEGEPCIITEKIHGCNFRAVWNKGKLWVGSHNVLRAEYDPNPNLWKRTKWWFEQQIWELNKALGRKKAKPYGNPATEDAWWQVANRLNLRAKLKAHPGLVIFGEIFGPGIQDMEYGQKNIQLCLFDVYDLANQRYLDHAEMVGVSMTLGLNYVPVLHEGPYSRELAESLAEQESIFGGIREGVVIRNVDGMRKVQKLIGQRYYLREGA